MRSQEGRLAAAGLGLNTFFKQKHFHACGVKRRQPSLLTAHYVGASQPPGLSNLGRYCAPEGSWSPSNLILNTVRSEAPGTIFDRLFIEVRNTSGTLLGTLATFSNVNSGTAGVYVLRGPYNLNSWAGQTVRIQFRGTNDITLPTSFRVDFLPVDPSAGAAGEP